MTTIFEFPARAGQTLRVELIRATHVRLMDETANELRKLGQDYRFYGGYYESTPVEIYIPRTGNWFLLIENHERSEAQAKLLTGSQSQAS